MQRHRVMGQLPLGAAEVAEHIHHRTADPSGGIDDMGIEDVGSLGAALLQCGVKVRDIRQEGFPVRVCVRQGFLVGGIGVPDPLAELAFVHGQQEASVFIRVDEALDHRRGHLFQVPGRVHVDGAFQGIQQQAAAAPVVHALPGLVSPRLHHLMGDVVLAHPQGQTPFAFDIEHVALSEAAADFPVSRAQDQLRGRSNNRKLDGSPLPYRCNLQQFRHAVIRLDVPPQAVQTQHAAGVIQAAPCPPVARLSGEHAEVPAPALEWYGRNIESHTLNVVIACIGNGGKPSAFKLFPADLIDHGHRVVCIGNIAPAFRIHDPYIGGCNIVPCPFSCKIKLLGRAEIGPVNTALLQFPEGFHHRDGNRSVRFRNILQDQGCFGFIRIQAGRAAHHHQADLR